MARTRFGKQRTSVRSRRKKRLRRAKTMSRGTKCRFCREKVDSVDYKEVDLLAKLTTAQGKIFSRKRSGNCAKHQRQVQNAIKRARFLGLLAYVG